MRYGLDTLYFMIFSKLLRSGALAGLMSCLATTLWADTRLLVGYLQVEQLLPPTLSNLDPVPEDNGLAGANTGLKDNQTTGKFLGQTYELQSARVMIGEDARAAAREMLAVTPYLVVDASADDLRAIASGPTVSPIGTAKEAIETLQSAGIWEATPTSIRTHLEQAQHDTPPPLPDVTNTLVGSNRLSLEAMRDAAQEIGLNTRIVSDALTGDVSDAAKEVLAELIARPEPTALLFGGETTVKLTGTGRGGRNQELALRVATQAPEIAAKWVFLSGGTDGRDGPTDAAGGLVDSGTLPRIKAAGQDVTVLLANNDSYAALAAAGDLLMTRATGTNVADVQVLLIAP